MKKILFTICLLTIISQVPVSAHLIYENFDGFNCCYPWTFSGCTDGDGTAFVGITNESSISQSYNNADGNFLVAYNTTGAGCTDACGNVVAEMLGVDTWGSIGITICFEIAESDAVDGAEDWGPETSVIVAGSIDGGPEHSLMFSSGGQADSEPGLDSDCDGIADGGMIPFSAITSTFTTYCFDIPYDGAEIDVRVSFNGLNTLDRDIAIDNVELFFAQHATGEVDNDYPAVPSTPSCTGVMFPTCPTCDDGIQNGDEEGVDCGGTNCLVCPTCDDGIQNGDEEGLDCGGLTCRSCVTCDDGMQNGDEEGVDCGGTACPACPTCDDGIQNGNEEGVDCGGLACPACPTCDDGVQNGDELGVDCGAVGCPPCQATCNSSSRFADPNQVLLAGEFGLFVENELMQNYIDVEKIYIKYQTEINRILSSDEIQYQSVNRNFDQLQNLVMSLMLESFGNSNEGTVSTAHLAMLDAFLVSLGEATHKNELREEIANIRQFTPVMQDLELRDALIAFDRASGADMVIAPTLVQDRMSVYYEPAQTENAQFTIIDVNGKALRTYTRTNADARELQLNIEELPIGFYFMKMTSGDTVITKKFVKQ